MIYLAPTLAASRYLDKTEQWSALPPETKDHAVDLIQKGSGCGGKQEGGQERTVTGRWTAQEPTAGKKGAPDWDGEHGLGFKQQKGECHLSGRLSSPRLHADPAVSEGRWFLCGLVVTGQQHLVRLGEGFQGSEGVRTWAGSGQSWYIGRGNNQVPGAWA